MRYLVLFFLCFSLSAQEKIEFNPVIRSFDGYLNKVVFSSFYFNGNKKLKRYYRFYVFSNEPLLKVSFKFRKGKDGAINQFSLKDSTLDLIFMGNTYPSEIRDVYHNLSADEYLNSLPNFDEEYDIERKRYCINSVRIKFDAYDYKYYLPLIEVRGYPPLRSWFIFGRLMYPEYLKSRNKYYIGCYFYSDISESIEE